MFSAKFSGQWQHFTECVAGGSDCECTLDRGATMYCVECTRDRGKAFRRSKSRFPDDLLEFLGNGG
jgi:hypothetical protein